MECAENGRSHWVGSAVRGSPAGSTAPTTAKRTRPLWSARTVVPSGEVVFREEGGETLLRAGDSAGFRAGDANGLAIENRAGAPAILFEIGTRSPDETVRCPDVGLRLERRDGARRWVHRDGTPY